MEEFIKLIESIGFEEIKRYNFPMDVKEKGSNHVSILKTWSYKGNVIDVYKGRWTLYVYKGVKINEPTTRNFTTLDDVSLLREKFAPELRDITINSILNPSI